MEKAGAGQIMLLAGLEKTTTGDTIFIKDGEELLLESIEAREPVLGLAIEPESSKDEAKMLEALEKFVRKIRPFVLSKMKTQDNRFYVVWVDTSPNSFLKRIKREFKINLRAGKPRVTVREESIQGEGVANITGDRTIKAGAKRIMLKAEALLLDHGERGSGIVHTAEPAILPEETKLNAEQINIPLVSRIPY